MHVPLLVCLLSLCFVLITGTLQNGNQKAAREIAEKFTEMMERRNLEIEGNQQRSRWRQVKTSHKEAAGVKSRQDKEAAGVKSRQDKEAAGVKSRQVTLVLT